MKDRHRCQVYGPCLECGTPSRIRYAFYGWWHEAICAACEHSYVASTFLSSLSSPLASVRYVGPPGHWVVEVAND